MKDLLRAVYGYLLDYWNSVIAIVAIIGIAAAELIPQAERYFEFFAFLGLNAVVWTLVDIRHQIRRPDGDDGGRAIYGSMRQARQEIVDQLSQQLIRRGRRNVLIIGGRIRSIIELLREFADELEHGQLPGKASGLEISVLCMHPAFLKQWPVPGQLPEPERLRMGKDFAASVLAAVSELNAIARRESLVRRHVSITTSHYHSIPAVYGYVFSEDSVIWGGYTWNQQGSDVQGPSNPCYRIDAGQPDFESVRSWLISYADLLQAVRTERDRALEGSDG